MSIVILSVDIVVFHSHLSVGAAPRVAVQRKGSVILATNSNVGTAVQVSPTLEHTSA